MSLTAVSVCKAGEREDDQLDVDASSDVVDYRSAVHQNGLD